MECNAFTFLKRRVQKRTKIECYVSKTSEAQLMHIILIYYNNISQKAVKNGLLFPVYNYYLIARVGDLKYH